MRERQEEKQQIRGEKRVGERKEKALAQALEWVLVLLAFALLFSLKELSNNNYKNNRSRK